MKDVNTLLQHGFNLTVQKKDAMTTGNKGLL